ncbi:Long chain acyl-CoA synthetase 7 peroxisomal, partial [Kappamyces sp. JEL0680]
MSLGLTPFSEQSILQLKQKSVVVTPATADNETGVHRSGLDPTTLQRSFPNLKTIEDIWQHAVVSGPTKPCLGTRHPLANGQWSDYSWKSYAQVNEERQLFGNGLVHLYHQLSLPAEDTFVGIFAQNREEWIVADLGAMQHKITSVSLYATLGAESSKFIINHAGLPIIVAAIDKVPILFEIAKECPTLKTIVVLESPFPLDQDPIAILQKWGATLGLNVVPFKKVLQLGKQFPALPSSIQASDLACLQYTSGTTGDPKGVMLTHENFVSGCVSFYKTSAAIIGAEESYISYLPLAHIMERAAMVNLFAVNAAIGFFRGDLALLLEDIACLKPTVFMTVPRLLNRIHDKILAAALESGSAVKTALFKKAVADKEYYLANGGHLTHSLWDKIVFKKVQQVLGGRVKLIGTGSAPIHPDVLRFLRVCFGCSIIEGYGLTESTGGVCATLVGDFSAGNVGAIGLNAEVKLVSVPEMNYHARDKKGEIWGYFKNPEKTSEDLTPDGWFKTGDIGSFDKDGRLSIVDRKKNIFKLAQGEYVAPEKLENIYTKSSFVAQTFIYGDSFQSELVGVVVPDQEYVLPWAVQQGLLPKSTVLPPPP